MLLRLGVLLGVMDPRVRDVGVGVFDAGNKRGQNISASARQLLTCAERFLGREAARKKWIEAPKDRNLETIDRKIG